MANPYDPTGNGSLFGAIVNLTGEHAPRELSVARSQVMDDDVADRAERLLIEAAEELATHERSLLTFPWVYAVADCNPRLADILSRVMRKADLIDRSMDVARAGCFPQDAALLGAEEQTLRNAGLNLILILPFTGSPPDQIALWRLLAHRPNPALDSLIALVPELAEVRSARTAFPTDTMLLVQKISPQWPIKAIWRQPGHILWTAMQVGTTPRHIASRAAGIGVSELPAEIFSEDHVPAPMDLALLSGYLSGTHPWLDLDDPVPPGHIVSAAQRLDISMEDAAGASRSSDSTSPTKGRRPARKMTLFS